jgi:hypothetical protein
MFRVPSSAAAIRRVNLTRLPDPSAKNILLTFASKFNAVIAFAATTSGVSPFKTATSTPLGEPPMPAAVMVNVALPDPVIDPTTGVLSTCLVPIPKIAPNAEYLGILLLLLPNYIVV